MNATSITPNMFTPNNDGVLPPTHPITHSKNNNSNKTAIYALVACECSQVVTLALRKEGVNAYSCDIEPCYGGFPQYHIHDDCREYIKGRCSFVTETGLKVSVPCWHLIIAHPPCTYLSVVQSGRIFKGRGNHRVIIDRKRYESMLAAADFFRLCLNAKAHFYVVENPQINLKDTGLPRPDDCVSPHMWGNKYSKRTWLWLNNLPPLISGVINPHPKSYVHCTRGGRVRSKFFTEVATAMAQQYIPIIRQYLKNLD